MIQRLQSIADGQLLIYIGTRLFDFAERIKAELIEQAVLVGLNRALEDKAMQLLPEARPTFVPFRDTTQAMVDTPAQTRLIYDQDVERLDRLFAFVCFLDGMSKDEGVCMEIGYSYGKGVPAVAVVTDFIWRDYKNLRESDHVLDPILEVMLHRVIHQYKMPIVGKTYQDNLVTGLEEALRSLEHEVYLMCHSTPFSGSLVTGANADVDVYIDFGGGLYEWERQMQQRLWEMLKNCGFSCEIGSRYMAGRQDLSAQSFVRSLGRTDILKALGAKVLVFCADNNEMSSGSAALQGMARAIGKCVILYDSKATNIKSDNQYCSSRNLMIDCSADHIVSNLEDIPAVVQALY